MDRLHANQQLNVNDQLFSNNGLVRLIMQSDGNLVLYRALDGVPLWASNTPQTVVNHAIMQGDGNFVAYSAAGRAFWASGTNGHSGAYVIVQDDGNLVVYDGGNRASWASNTGLLSRPIEPCNESTDARGFKYVETKDTFKKFCTAFPCFAALQWPGYATKVIRDVKVNNTPVIIQLWKGLCERFPGQDKFPGGYGAEVGIYRLMPGRARPTSIPFLPAPAAAFILANMASVTDNDLWWAFPELNAQIEFDFINPFTGEPAFHAGPENTYWLNKWMNEASYSSYRLTQGRKWSWLPEWFPGNSRSPNVPTSYTLKFKINGVSFDSW